MYIGQSWIFIKYFAQTGFVRKRPYFSAVGAGEMSLFGEACRPGKIVRFISRFPELIRFNQLINKNPTRILRTKSVNLYYYVSIVRFGSLVCQRNCGECCFGELN